MKNQLVFVTGGARSGKSTFAIKMADKSSKNVVFIATGVARDSEMHERISNHKEARPKSWHTIEEPYDLAKTIPQIPKKTDMIVIDCLTLLVSNLLLSGKSSEFIESEFYKFILNLKNLKFNVIIVSNEVGLGIVPDNELARKFRDISGKINQIAAKNCDTVYFMVSGIPWRIKE